MREIIVDKKAVATGIKFTVEFGEDTDFYTVGDIRSLPDPSTLPLYPSTIVHQTFHPQRGSHCVEASH